MAAVVRRSQTILGWADVKNYDMDFELERPFAENILKAAGLSDKPGRPATQKQFNAQIDVAIEEAAAHGHTADEIYEALRREVICYGILV